MSSAGGGRGLVVDAMSATLVGVPATAEAHAWLDRTTTAMAYEHLPRALSDASLPAGHWFIPRLDLALRCRGLATLPGLADGWSRAIVDSLSASLASDPDWVHFPTKVELVAAIVASAATGRRDEDWAWEQAGLPVSAFGSPTARVDAALRLHPEVAVAALSRAASECGVAALDRALGESGWYAVADALDARHALVDDPPIGRAAPRPEEDTARYRAAPALLEASSFGRLVLHSRLRPSRGVATLWAWLVVAEVEPALLSSPGDAVSPVLQVIEARLSVEPVTSRGSNGRIPPHADDDGDDARTTGAAGPTPEAVRGSGEPTAPTRADERPSTRHEDRPAPAVARDAPSGAGAHDRDTATAGAQLVPEPELETPDPRARRSTGWAGLVLLLATADAAGLPERVTDDPGLTERGVRWAVWQASLALTQARTDDPAVLALCGLDPSRAAVVLDSPPARPDERERVMRLARRWRRVTLRRLRAAPHGGETVPTDRRAQWDWLVRRPGEVVATTGWIDVVLPLRSVDTAVRSAGLDLDPGFVPWLGTVVEIRYE